MSDENNNTKKQKYSHEVGRAFQLLFHVDAMFQQRFSNFLLAETILFATLAAIYGSPSTDKKVITIILSAMGCCLTTLFWFTLYRLHKGLRFLIIECKELSPFYDAFAEIGRKQKKGENKDSSENNRGVTATQAYVWFIPIIVFVFWAAIFYLSVQK